MLAGVLLHVIESARPVDCSVYGIADLERAVLHYVGDRPAVIVDNIDHAQPPQGPGVERLAARRGIEGRAIERDAKSIAGALDAGDGRFELAQGRIVVVEAVGHVRIPAAQAQASSRSTTPASSKPFARSTQLSQRRQGRPCASGS